MFNAQELEEYLRCVLNSYQRLLGRPLIDCGAGAFRPDLDAADFVLLSHGTEDDPVFNFGNQRALALFGFEFDAFCQLPSRFSAEPINRDARTALLRRVTEHGYIDNYSGVRVARDGRRFEISEAIVWNVEDDEGRYLGQAAVFSRWRELMPALFAYGTLMCDEIMQRVCGQQLQSIPARLTGYQRWQVLAEEYPAIVAAAGQSVNGVLYDGLNAEGWRRLDAFEGDEYQRMSLDVLVEGGLCRADVYVFQQDRLHRLSEQPWDFEAFLREGGRERFEARYRGYAQIDAVMPGDGQ